MSDNIIRKIANTFVPLIIPLTLCFLLILYAPLELLFANRTEFNYNMYELISYMLPVMLCVYIILSIILLILKKKNEKVYSIAVFLLVILLLTTYIQGTFLSGNLPPLDGRKIDWDEYKSQRLISFTLIIVVSVTLFFVREITGREKFEKAFSFLAGFMLIVLGISLALNCIASEGYRRNKVIVHSDSSLLDMANDKENLVIFLIDAVDGEKLQKVMQYHPEYQEIFEDFSIYNNVTSAYPYTSRSIPFLLSGIWYENEKPFEEYCKIAFEQSPLFLKLREKNFRMGMYDPEYSFLTNLDGKFENISSDSSLVYPFQFIRMQLNMTGYRYFLFDLKKLCYMTPEELYLASVKSNGEEQYYSMDNMEFLERLKNKQVVSSDISCFRYIYIRGAHEPFIYPARSYQTDDNSYESSVEVCMEIADTYLRKLKDAEVYDNTAIIFLADHGYADDNASFGRQNPMLMIKGINEKHPFMQSEAPISHDDLQEAYFRLLNGKASYEVFDWQSADQRERRFLFFEYEDEEHMKEYIQTGHASCEETMFATGKEYNLN